MESIYGHRTLSATVAKSASVSAAIPILSYNKVAIELPGGTNLVGAGSVYVQICQTATGGTFRRFGVFDPSGSGNTIDFVVSGYSAGYVVVDGLAGFSYMKVESSVSATAAAGWGVVVHGIM
jgi:hypothetical protein